MVLGLLALMGRPYLAAPVHAWIGAGLTALSAAHHLFSRGRYRGRRHTPLRTVQVALQVLLLAAVLALGYSGARMTWPAAALWPAGGGLPLARRLHILGAYWGFLLMGLYLGVQWHTVLAAVRRRRPARAARLDRASAWFVLALLVAGYGIWGVIKRDLLAYLFLQTEFVFYDYGEPAALFYLDYLGLLGLWVFIGHYAAKSLRPPRPEHSAVQTGAER